MGKKGVPVQITAAVASVLGILTGKYIAWVYFLDKALKEEGRELISYFSARMVSIFFQSMQDVFSGYEIIFGIIVIFAAVKLAKSPFKNLAASARREAARNGN